MLRNGGFPILGEMFLKWEVFSLQTMYLVPVPTIITIIFWNFTIFWFRSCLPQANQNLISSNTSVAS